MQNIEGYIQYEKIRSLDHKLLGMTTKGVQNLIALVTSNKYLYSRQRYKGSIAIYWRDNTSPTGVIQAGSFPVEFEFLLKSFSKTGALSPTEDLRTGR